MACPTSCYKAWDPAGLAWHGKRPKAGDGEKKWKPAPSWTGAKKWPKNGQNHGELPQKFIFWPFFWPFLSLSSLGPVSISISDFFLPFLAFGRFPCHTSPAGSQYKASKTVLHEHLRSALATYISHQSPFLEILRNNTPFGLRTSPPLTEVSRALWARNAEKVSNMSPGASDPGTPKSLQKVSSLGSLRRVSRKCRKSLSGMFKFFSSFRARVTSL